MKSIEWVPTSGGDAGKVFVITRMSAFAADKWACRVMRALTRAGAKVPDSVLANGMLGMTGAAVNIFAEMTDADCEEAFDGLMKCCKIKRAADMMPEPILDLDITDARTIPDLRVEAFKLHLDFFMAAASHISPLAAAIMGEQKQEPETPT